MGPWELTTVLLFAGLAIRQCVAVASVRRAARFLSDPPPAASAHDGPQPFIVIALPVLREQTLIRECVEHFLRLAAGHNAAVAVITTEREVREPGRSAGSRTTIELVRALQDEHRFTHLHYPEPNGTKADQLNYLSENFRRFFPDADPHLSYFLYYDADSRPTRAALESFEYAIRHWPHVNVFQQSAVFTFRMRSANSLRNAFLESTALRAMRFVLAYEVPRLLGRLAYAAGDRRPFAWLAHLTYAHVTGHGLCVRCAFVSDLLFPARTVMEDMFYGFLLSARQEPVVPVATLDDAEVPGSVRQTLRQSARWFLGPSRFAEYYRHPAVPRGPYAMCVATSCLFISLEWLSCAVIPLAVAIALIPGAPAVAATAGLFALIYLTTLLMSAHFWRRIAGDRCHPVGAVLMYPLCCTAFGWAGFLGLYYLLRRGVSASGAKTERA